MYTEVVNIKDYDPEDKIAEEVCKTVSVQYVARPGAVPLISIIFQERQKTIFVFIDKLNNSF